MESKLTRINNSLENIEVAIKYYLQDLENKYLTNKISKKDYIRIADNFRDIGIILNKLKSIKTYDIKKLNIIRTIHLSIKSLYDEGDYEVLINEMMKTNNELCKEDKEKDRKCLDDLKKIVNRLSNFYQYRLKKAEKRGKTIGYDDKVDNIRFIVMHYLNVKYNFKKIKYEEVDIEKIVEQCKQNFGVEDTKKVHEYAKAGVIVANLQGMRNICDEKEYLNIKDCIDNLLVKYTQRYEDEKEQLLNEPATIGRIK